MARQRIAIVLVVCSFVAGGDSPVCGASAGTCRESEPEDEETAFAAARDRAEARGGCYITGGGDLPGSPRRMRLRAGYDLCRKDALCRGITAHVGGPPSFEKTYDVHFKSKYDCSKSDEWFTLAASKADEDKWHVVRESDPWVPPDLSLLLALPNATLLSEDPMLLQLDGFLSDEEIDHIIRLAEPRLETSTTTMARTKDNRRTSKTAWLQEPEHYGDQVLGDIDERIAIITGIPRINMEYPQVLRYGKTEFYTGHSDFIPEHLQSPCGARLGTFFMYLSDVDQGGATKFPKLGLEVKPTKGRAVLWWNVNVSHWREFGLKDAQKAREDSRLFHTALPVEEGAKWAVNRWLHQSNFVDNHRLGLLG